MVFTIKFQKFPLAAIGAAILVVPGAVIGSVFGLLNQCQCCVGCLAGAGVGMWLVNDTESYNNKYGTVWLIW